MKSFLIPVSFLVLGGTLTGSVAGCGAGPQPVDEASIKADTDKAVRARAIFDGSGGDYAKVTAEEKAELTKLYGSAANAEKVWALMKNPPGSSPTTGPSGG